MIYYTGNYNVFGLPIDRYSNEHNISKSGCFLPHFMGCMAYTLLGPLERANLQVQ
jgi:hypothetical protein